MAGGDVASRVTDANRDSKRRLYSWHLLGRQQQSPPLLGLATRGAGRGLGCLPRRLRGLLAAIIRRANPLTAPLLGLRHTTAVRVRVRVKVGFGIETWIWFRVRVRVRVRIWA